MQVCATCKFLDGLESLSCSLYRDTTARRLAALRNQRRLAGSVLLPVEAWPVVTGRESETMPELGTPDSFLLRRLLLHPLDLSSPADDGERRWWAESQRTVLLAPRSTSCVRRAVSSLLPLSATTRHALGVSPLCALPSTPWSDQPKRVLTAYGSPLRPASPSGERS